MAENIVLKGITWNHSRGFTPMSATGQRFSELNPQVTITWEKRSLQQFADLSIQQLAERYDLLVIDHPWAGFASKTNSILPFDKYLPDDYLKDQEINSVGQSYESYHYNDHQWALAIDAAAPVAASRPDLMKKHGLSLPKTYNELLSIARKGLVAFPAIPIDALMTFYTFCCSLGEDPCGQEDVVISKDTGTKALQLYRGLSEYIDPACFDCNPIQTYEAMTGGDEIAYCPFAYGYSNYSRDGYARRLLHFHDMITLNGRSNLRSALGGTGLAVSANCAHVDIAMQYAAYVASQQCQSGLYTDNGGQPGYLTAWTNPANNQKTNNYFSNTLPALQRAYLRPRYFGHMFFQDHAGDIVRDYLIKGGSETQVLAALNDLYVESKTKIPA